jgi:cell division initiation protein
VTHEHAFPYYRTPDEIREQEFAHRMRGLDEFEVREFLDLLADQVRASESEGAEYRAEIERLRGEVKRLQDQGPQRDSDEINPQAVMLFSQAQQVADQLVEEAVRHARDMMTSARNQQREILQRAHEAAEEAVRGTEAVPAQRAAERSDQGRGQVPTEGYGYPVKEIEYVRTFAQVAQVQLRSVLEALTEQVDKLGDLPRLPQATDSSGSNGPSGAMESTESGTGTGQDSGSGSAAASERTFVYPRPQPTGHS